MDVARNVDGNVDSDPRATKLLRSLNKSGIFDKEHKKDDGTVNRDAQDVYMQQVTEVLELGKNSTINWLLLLLVNTDRNKIDFK